ncbi:AbrB/MazE/SpoVT family DNA-binding domain-containing protein [Candidatus Saccharibacteria bacterium]|nr:AbrB/MazE/SpoVT family DNA-binding domain-containing protein [Candidatus Saccharibacteria bacterium]MBI3338381.1 AbrB/MazE/SpoVT family DNA-binding domain-containing protein [Candidatus Saccharibacteria bacterium]
MKTTTKVKKWGNSLAIRIPQAVIQDLGLSSDSQLQLTSNGKSVTLKPKATKAKKIGLEKLLEGVTPENIHPEVDWGPPVGKEIW